MNEDEFVFHIPDPVLALPSPDRLELLDEEIADEIMWLGNRVLNLGRALDALDLSARNFDGFFERRREGYSPCGASDGPDRPSGQRVRATYARQA